MRGRHIGKRHRLAAERGYIDALRIDPNRPHGGAEAPKCEIGALIAGVLDRHRGVGDVQQPTRQVEAFLRSGDDDDFFGARADTARLAQMCGDRGSQRPVAGRVAIVRERLLRSTQAFDDEALPGGARKQRRVRPSDAPTVAIRLNNLALFLRATNRLSEAEPLYRRALMILAHFTRATGHQHPNFEMAHANYVQALTELGRSKAEIEAALRSVL
jgi:hypothetical protein